MAPSLARLIVLVALCGLLAACGGPRSAAHSAPDASARQITVDRAEAQVRELRAAPGGEYEVWLTQSRGIVLLPAVVKAAWFFGLRGGTGVLLVRDDAGFWSEPVFVAFGGPNFGLQAGVQEQSIVVFLDDDEAVDAVLSGEFGLDMDFSLSAMAWGAYTGHRLAPPFDGCAAFIATRGAYAGVNLDGVALGVSDRLDREYYGRDVTPDQVLFERRFYLHSGPDALQRALLDPPRLPAPARVAQTRPETP